MAVDGANNPADTPSSTPTTARSGSDHQKSVELPNSRSDEGQPSRFKQAATGVAVAGIAAASVHGAPMLHTGSAERGPSDHPNHLVVEPAPAQATSDTATGWTSSTGYQVRVAAPEGVSEGKGAGSGETADPNAPVLELAGEAGEGAMKKREGEEAVAASEEDDAKAQQTPEARPVDSAETASPTQASADLPSSRVLPVDPDHRV